MNKILSFDCRFKIPFQTFEAICFAQNGGLNQSAHCDTAVVKGDMFNIQIQEVPDYENHKLSIYIIDIHDLYHRYAQVSFLTIMSMSMSCQ